jgi:hypothetical protein
MSFAERIVCDQLTEILVCSRLIRCSTRLPRKLLNLISSTQLKQVHHVCLGYQDSFLLTWRDGNGQDRIDSAGLPAELTNFLYARDPQRRLVRSIPSIRCVLGPYNSSYFVHDGSAYAWMNLPDDLLRALQSRIKDGSWIDRPRIVALGANSNFLLVTEQHIVVWELDKYRALRRSLEKARSQQDGIHQIHSVVLHAYRYDSSVTELQDGALQSSNLPPPAVSGLQSMLEPLMRDTKERNRKIPLRAASEMRATVQRNPSVLQQRAQLRREWSEHSQEFTAQAKGVKVSLSLNISLGGLARMLG